MMQKIKTRKVLIQIIAFTFISFIAGMFNPWSVFSGEILARVLKNQEVICGVPEPITGFCFKDKNGRWQGFNVDFCRAVAVAALGDPEKADFIPLISSNRLPVLLSERIDLLAHLTTWTFGREAEIGVRFPGIYFYDGHTFMTPVNKKVKHIKDLDGAVICVIKKTNIQSNVENTFQHLGIKFKPLVVDSMEEMINALNTGRCQACVATQSVLSALRAQIPDGLKKYEIMKEKISKEPLCPSVLAQDDEWLSLVRWVLFALIEAEELGITSTNVRDLQKKSADPKIQWFLNSSGKRGKALGLKPDWTADVIAAVGNYGEIFDRNLGSGSGLNIDRGLNRLWNQGGLLYAPPFQ